MALQTQGLVLAQGRRYKNRWSVQAMQETPAQAALFDTQDYRLLQQSVTVALKALPLASRKPWTRVQIALPDPLVQCQVFALEEWPKGNAARQAFVAWKMSEHLQLNASNFVFTHQLLGTERGRYLVLMSATQAPLLWAVSEAFSQQRMAPAVIDAAGVFQFNALAPLVKKTGAMLVSLTRDYWSMMIWDDQARLRHLSSQWRAPQATDTSVQDIAIAEELERRTRAHMRAADAPAIEKLLLSGDADDVGALFDVLQARQVQALERLHLQAFSASGIQVDSLHPAVAASRCR